MTTRRDFIKTSAIGLGLISNFDLLGAPAGMSLPRSSAAAQGVDIAGIRNFLDAAKASGLEWHSFMLVRHGHVVSEGWWKPFAAPNKHTLYSLSKSFTSTAIGFLVSEGKIKVTDSVVSFFPDLAPPVQSQHLKDMTVKHLLTMNTGHHTDSLPDIRAKLDQNWVKTFLEKPVEHAPGSFFMYNTGATYILGAIVHKITGQTLDEYLEPRLFKPLGIVGYDWEKSPQGLNVAGYGLRVSTEDIAKFGQLYLQKGKWQGNQLLPATWIEEATSAQTTSQAGNGDWSQGYGYQFWRCKPGFYRGDGKNGQFCMVMPEYDAVLAMTCESFDLQKTMNVAYETILPALKSAKLPQNDAEEAKVKMAISKLALNTPKGSLTSPLSKKYSEKIWNVAENPYSIKQLEVRLFADAGVIRIDQGAGFKKIGFGWEKWQVNPAQQLNPFSSNTVKTRIAATGTWADKATLQINFKFVDQVHGDKISIHFDENNATITLLNSESENQKTNIERREPLKATLA